LANTKTIRITKKDLRDMIKNVIDESNWFHDEDGEFSSEKDAESLSRYDVGQYYKWHHDAGIETAYKPIALGNRSEPDARSQDFINTNIELVRKLSFALQLSDPDDYEGGNVQLMDEGGNSYIAPRQKGSIMLFDSRTPHRVHKVTRGVRKSIVGWVVGPRWK